MVYYCKNFSHVLNNPYNCWVIFKRSLRVYQSVKRLTHATKFNADSSFARKRFFPR